MGMSSGSSGTNSINVTPLIDVLLVLLIVFLVAMPIMMKKEELSVPPTIPPDAIPDPTSVQIVVKLLDGDQQVLLTENEAQTSIAAGDVLRVLRPKLATMTGMTGKVVFVDFEDEVSWGSALAMVDSIRSLAADTENHDEIKVALKMR